MSDTSSKASLHPSDRESVWPPSWLAGLKARLGSKRGWVSAAEPVLLLHVDGSQSVWRENSRVPDGRIGRAPKFTAIQAPEDLLLRRSLLLPRMSGANCAAAVLLDVQSNNPFPPEELAWGSQVRELGKGEKRVDIVLSSRRHLSELVQSRWPELATATRHPEVWALTGENSRVVIQGYGETHRLHSAAVQRRWNWALLGIALAMATLVAITPTVRLRLRAIEAADAYEATLRRVAPLVRKRDELSALNDRVRSLDSILADRVDPAGVLEYLTTVLPDDTYLYSLDVQKSKITASGHTADASALLQKLSKDPKLKNVRSPTAVTRMPGATKEAFVIEFTMEPQIVPSPAPGAAAMGAAPASSASAATTAPVASNAPVIAGAGSSAGITGSAAAAAVQPAPAAPKAATPSVPARPSPFVIGGSR